MKIIAWAKSHKLAILLLLIILILFVRQQNLNPLVSKSSPLSVSPEALPGVGGVAYNERAAISTRQAAPQPEVKDRLVVTESYLSLQVDNVRSKMDEVVREAEKAGGYMVSSNLSQPEQAPFATVVVRVPSSKLQETLAIYRKMAIKVASENLVGYDVTDQYVDLEARLGTLEKTKTKFEAILAQAVNVDQILTVQRELINLQDQIDSLKGRQDYLKKTAENSKLTVYLSSDEWALPYSPSQTFRPKVVFKNAVRSLIMVLRGFVVLVIWLIVFSVIWLPALLIYRKFKKRNT